MADDHKRPRDEEFSRSRLKDFFLGSRTMKIILLAAVLVILEIPPVQGLLVGEFGVLVRYLASMILPILAIVAVFVLTRTKR